MFIKEDLLKLSKRQLNVVLREVEKRALIQRILQTTDAHDEEPVVICPQISTSTSTSAAVLNELQPISNGISQEPSSDEQPISESQIISNLEITFSCEEVEKRVTSFDEGCDTECGNKYRPVSCRHVQTLHTDQPAIGPRHTLRSKAYYLAALHIPPYQHRHEKEG
ncbi:hypothetical protein BV898_11916 [Hypsibius exemplaris]|uniref:Uncharacterized protein n=1 Tax=Hypsibius exemplaris TaxID=2072580 RepID=A0A1W0WFG9_HYPEX|nr:hypothetical protein BV898_11916 [Hypsibius exemplaris]